MRWIDVFGPPGVGKSTICDDLWPPHSIEWKHIKTFPREWEGFIGATNELLNKVKHHFSYRNCLGMVGRSYCKMAAVREIKSDDIYIQTGFAQRGLGFGWRLKDPEDIRRFYELMPVSLGVVSLWAPTDVIIARNRSPGRVATNENRDFMVPLMERPREIALEVLRQRGVPLLELDTRKPPEELREELLAFRDRRAKEVVQSGPFGFDRQETIIPTLVEWRISESGI